MKRIKMFIMDTGGDAVVEATILFPIIIMIFAGLVLLAMYMPIRSSLQRATQQAVTAIATEKSDTWLSFNENTLQFGRATSAPNVYAALKGSMLSQKDRDKAVSIVKNMEKKTLFSPRGTLSVECGTVNYLIYKEITVTATRNIPMPVDLSFVGFPKALVITASSTAVVHDVDGFIRDVDMLTDILPYLGWGVSKASGLIEAVGDLFSIF